MRISRTDRRGSARRRGNAVCSRWSGCGWRGLRPRLYLIRPQTGRAAGRGLITPKENGGSTRRRVGRNTADALGRRSRCLAISATTRDSLGSPFVAGQRSMAVEALLPRSQHRETRSRWLCAVGHATTTLRSPGAASLTATRQQTLIIAACRGATDADPSILCKRRLFYSLNDRCT